MSDTAHLEPIIKKIKDFLSKAIDCSEVEKLEKLKKESTVVQFLKKNSFIKPLIESLSQKEELALYSAIFLQQDKILFAQFNNTPEDITKLRGVLKQLLIVENFYRGMGGVIGYHATTIELIFEKLKLQKSEKINAHYKRANGLNLSRDRELSEKAVIEGIKNQERMAEIYPIGGAGDRLDLIAEDGIHLPAALLPFLGRSLLEGLIRDLQAREYLYFKLFNKQLVTPIALMTSFEKDNDCYIHKICEELSWFGRGKENFRLFVQPLVPVITVEGFWRLRGPLDVVFKPGGHGVIWKLAKEEKIFEWLKAKGCKKTLIRQINNPLAGQDVGLLAFTGWGCSKSKSFGFLSCERLIGSAEGVLVLVEEKHAGSASYRITNLEYTDFEKFGIQDQPEYWGSPYSQYSSNTNVLFFDIESIEKLISKVVVPGLLVNMKRDRTYDPIDAISKEVSCARLESTMQNIADTIVDTFDKPLSDREIQEKLKIYIVYNERWKTISVTKRSYVKGKSHLETPVGAFYDLLHANHKLLEEYCGFLLPKKQSVEAYLESGPSYLFLYHPALGPLYSVIAKKLRKGRFSENAELQLEAAEVDIEGLTLEGSLIIKANSPLGSTHEELLKFDEQCGRIELYNVHIKNLGRAKEQHSEPWKNNFLRVEAVTIILEGKSEFFAKDLFLEGSHTFEVPDGERWELSTSAGKVVIDKKQIAKPTWRWNYALQDNKVVLSRAY